MSEEIIMLAKIVITSFLSNTKTLDIHSLITVKNLYAMQETWVWFLGGEDPLEKGMTTHSSILAWRIPWTEEPGRLQSMGSKRVGPDWATNTQMHWYLDNLQHETDIK